MNEIVKVDSEESPRAKIQKYSKKVPKTRKRRRVTDDEFSILKPGEQENLSMRNYKVQHLKIMCRHYKQRVGGNKDELTKRMYNYLRLSYYILSQLFTGGIIFSKSLLSLATHTMSPEIEILPMFDLFD